MNASSLTRFSNTSSSAERLIRMVRAFLAMGYMSKQEHISKQFFFFFFSLSVSYRVIANQELQVSDW